MPVPSTPHVLMLLAGLSLTPAAMAAVSTNIFVEPTTPGTGDGFGSSLAIGDLFFVAGAPADDDVAPDGGSVTIYFADPSTGLPGLATLETPMGLSPGASFGKVVAANQDTFVVSAPAQHNSGASPVGAVYVYTVGTSVITLQAVLQPTSIIPSDLFGQDVDIVGDTIVVGAPGSAGGEGSVFVYNRMLTDWSAGTEILGPHGDDGDGFGWSVALDHDDEKRMIVGAPWDSDAGHIMGRVHVYENLMWGWVPAHEIDSSDIGSPTHKLGFKLDFDGDHFAAGEPFTGDGSVHIIGWDPGTTKWGLVETLTPTTTASYSLFGESFSLHDELLAVGVRQSDLNGTASGAGYLFRLVAYGDWNQLVELEDAGGSAAYGLGHGVSTSEGIMIMGSPGAKAAGTTQGGLVFGWDVRSTPGCPADIEMTGNVDADDILALLLGWGTCAGPSDCPEDIDGNGAANVTDLMVLLSNWGSCH